MLLFARPFHPFVRFSLFLVIRPFMDLGREEGRKEECNHNHLADAISSKPPQKALISSVHGGKLIEQHNYCTTFYTMGNLEYRGMYIRRLQNERLGVESVEVEAVSEGSARCSCPSRS